MKLYRAAKDVYWGSGYAKDRRTLIDGGCLFFGEDDAKRLFCSGCHASQLAGRHGVVLWALFDWELVFDDGGAA